MTPHHIEKHHSQVSIGRMMASNAIRLGYDIADETFDAGAMHDIETRDDRKPINRFKGAGE